MELAFCETEGGRNRHEEQRQEPYSKGSILTAVESRLPYGLNIVNSYFAMFNRDSEDFLALARDRFASSLVHFLELLRAVPNSPARRNVRLRPLRPAVRMPRNETNALDSLNCGAISRDPRGLAVDYETANC